MPLPKPIHVFYNNCPYEYYYHIAIFCVKEWGYTTGEREKIIYDSSRDCTTDRQPSQRIAELLEEGLKWEYELYDKCGYSTEGAKKIIAGHDGIEFPIVYSALDAFGLKTELEQVED